MITFIILLALLTLVSLLGWYHKIPVLQPGQWRFLISSTILLYIIVVIFRFFLLGELSNMSSKNTFYLLSDTSLILPILFYFIWYMLSSVIGNLITGTSSDYTSFGGSPDQWVSQQQNWQI